MLEVDGVDGPALLPADLVQSDYLVAAAAFGFELEPGAALIASFELNDLVLAVAGVAGVFPPDDSGPDDAGRGWLVVQPAALTVYSFYAHG